MKFVDLTHEGKSHVLADIKGISLDTIVYPYLTPRMQQCITDILKHDFSPKKQRNLFRKMTLQRFVELVPSYETLTEHVYRQGESWVPTPSLDKVQRLFYAHEVLTAEG